MFGAATGDEAAAVSVATWPVASGLRGGDGIIITSLQPDTIYDKAEVRDSNSACGGTRQNASLYESTPMIRAWMLAK